MKRPLSLVIVCVLAQASIVSCQRRQAYLVPKGFLPYLIQDDLNRMFLVCLPERFTVTRSKHRDDYQFDCKDGASISISATSDAPSGLLKMNESDMASKDVKGKVYLRAGAFACYRLLREMRVGSGAEAIGTWSRASTSLVFLWKHFKNNDDEIKEILASIEFDEQMQNVESAREYTGQRVKQLDRSSTGPRQ